MCREMRQAASDSALCYLNIATSVGSVLFSPESRQKYFKAQKEQLHQLQLILTLIINV